MVDSGRRGLNSIDPGIAYESYNIAIPSLTSDGLVAYNHVGGSDGSTLVPLADGSVRHDLLVYSDEIYDRLAYGTYRHRAITEGFLSIIAL